MQVNSYERDRAARLACISHYGPVCTICGLVFEERYGAIGTGYIHVHHLVPLSEIGENYSVDPDRGSASDMSELPCNDSPAASSLFD